MAKLKIGGDRARAHDAVISQGCGFAPGHFGYSLYVRSEDSKKRVAVRLDAKEARRVLDFLEGHRAQLEKEGSPS